MTTLTADISDVATSWRVSDLPASPYLIVDDEIVRIKARFESGQTPPGRAYPNTITVERAQAGTSRASHSSGTTLAPYFPDAPVGGNGSEQTVRLLGPFHVDYQDAGLINPINAGLPAGFEIESGSVIVALWMAQTGDVWNGTGTHWLQLAYGSAANAIQILTLDGSVGPGTDARGLGSFLPSEDVVANLIPFVTLISGDIVVSWNDVTGEVSGEGDVYALVASPA